MKLLVAALICLLVACDSDDTRSDVSSSTPEAATGTFDPRTYPQECTSDDGCFATDVLSNCTRCGCANYAAADLPAMRAALAREEAACSGRLAQCTIGCPQPAKPACENGRCVVRRVDAGAP